MPLADDVPSADRDDDGLITVAEISTMRAAAKTASWTVEQSVAKAKSLGSKLTPGARKYIDAGGLDTASDKLVESASFVVDTVMSRVVKPLFKAFWLVPVMIAAGLGMLFWGSDLRVFQGGVNGFPGLADLPILIASLAIDATAPIGSMILTFIYSTNREIVTAIVNQAGGFAPPLILAYQLVTLGLLLALFWSGVKLASTLPVVSTLVAGAGIVTKPLRSALGGVFNR